ncbi:MAG: class I SAM-dependent methyltransferase [Casimicrobiaceae bacterium]
MSELLTRVRRHELESVRAFFAPGAMVLELGGGNGFQASIIDGWGCTVHSFDLAGRRPTAHAYHAVADYDGVHLPLPDASIDVAFSSNVLEHVRELPALLTETRRVLKPGGIGVHILPTPTWRLWSIIAHYPFLVFTALHMRTGFVDWSDKKARQARTSERGVAYLIKRILWPGPHGEFPGALTELSAFRAAHWTRALASAGFAVESVTPTGIYYSGYGLFPHLATTTRCAMARILGSSTQTFVVRNPLPTGLHRPQPQPDV